MSSGSHRFRDVEKDEEKQNFTSSLQLILFYPVSCGKMAVQTILAPFPTSVLLRSPQHLPSVPSGSQSFSTNTPVCLLRSWISW